MRPTARRATLLAVLFSAATIIFGPGVAHAATDVGIPVPPTAAAADTAPDPGHRPSCSLFPLVHGDAGWVFENHNHQPRFLTATAADGTVLFNDWLTPVADGGTPTPLLVGVIHVAWAGDSYDVAEYALADVHFCAEEAAPPPPTTVPPPPVTAPPTTEPPVSVPPTTTPAPPPTTAPPTTEPPTVAEPPTLTAATCSTDAAGDAVCGVTVARADGLPVTGANPWLSVLLATGLCAAGALLLPWQRRRARA